MRLVACFAPHFWHASFRINEFKLMLSDWLTVFAWPRSISFSLRILNDSQKGAGFLPCNLACLELWTRRAFPILPLRGSIGLRPCDRCFGPEGIAGMDSFPFTDLLGIKYSQAVFGASAPFRPFLPEGINIITYTIQTGIQLNQALFCKQNQHLTQTILYALLAQPTDVFITRSRRSAFAAVVGTVP